MTSEELNIDAEWLKSEIRNNLTELESLVKGPREGCLALTILRRYDMLLKSLKTETPELPPVSPEGLVEGEWYAFECCGSKQIGQVGHVNNTKDLRVRCGNHIHSLHDMVLYGPLRFRIGGAS